MADVSCRGDGTGQRNSKGWVTMRLETFSKFAVLALWEMPGTKRQYPWVDALMVFVDRSTDTQTYRQTTW